MLILPGAAGRDLCDRNLGLNRRELLRIGGSSLLGLSLADLLGMQRAAAGVPAPAVPRGFGRAKA